MGGSTKKPRRRAAGPALRYAHVRGARSASPAERRARNREGDDDREDRRFGVLMALTVVAVIVLSALAGFVWGRRLWAEVAPGWPGGGYGFAVTTGLLTPPAVAAVVVPLKRANWRKEKARSLGWAAAALPGAALSFVILLITFSATRPKRRRRGPECYDPGQACWVQEQYPYIWFVGLAAAVLCTALGGWIAYRYAQRRKRLLTPPEPAAPSDPPRPDRPTCT